jgi:hypothetical protein
MALTEVNGRLLAEAVASASNAPGRLIKKDDS